MTGLFFGSFNPIHTGHLIIAEFMRQQAKLDAVWFILSPQNPLKKEMTLWPEKDRLKLLKLAIKGNKYFSANDIEFHLSKPSYTIHTLEALAKMFPRKKFALMMGSDNLDILEQWKDYQKILDTYQVLIYKRNEVASPASIQHAHLTFFEAPYLNISSTLIRKLVSGKQSIRYLVPENVGKYIETHKLYSKK
ncbi:MAG: nicotinate (nicotinamide) nucleotide adenylyltransferase [Chitinophagales bacterium]